MKFTSEFTSKLNRKAWAIYRVICPQFASKEARRNYRKEAFRQAFKGLYAAAKGIVKFFKQDKDFAEVCERRIMSLEQFGYIPKTDKKITDPRRFLFVDLDKFFSGEKNPIISTYSYQLL